MAMDNIVDRPLPKQNYNLRKEGEVAMNAYGE